MSEQINFDQIFEGVIEPGKEPKRLFKEAYEGAITAVSYAEILLNQAIRTYGPDHPVGYPDTAYYLPVIRCLSGEEIKTLGDMVPVLNRVRAQFKEDFRDFTNARLAGEATWYAAEIIEAIRYLKHTPENPLHVPPWTGFIGDPVVRQYGTKMVDWTIPGEAVIIGRAKDSKAAKKIVDSFMAKGLMLFLCDEIIEQLLEEGVKLGVDYIAYPLGNFTQVVHAANYALRAGMMFGGIKPGLRDAQRDYQRRRVLAFILYLGEHDMVKTAAALGAINVGFPVITDQPLPEDKQIKDWFISEPDYDKIVQTCLEVRGIKITAIDIDVPITVGPAFEGESIRKKDMYVEFGGTRTPSFELVRMVGPDEIEDGKIEVIGPDIDTVEPGSAMPLGIVVDIYGRKMQEDFEPVLERRIHYFINYGEGLWHVAQRDIMWVRISKDAYSKGFRLRHIGDILYAKFKAEFPSIVDRVQVTIYTDEQKVLEMREIARQYYKKRDDRLKQLRDETVDTFYSCTLCQSFAPTHVCVIAPERVGLCGAVSWLDAKAAYEINPHGSNQPIPKEGLIDPVKGQWKSFNDFVYANSQRTIQAVNFYTIMEYPMTSCGCFECILAMVPECNGFMVVNREHSGMTPSGMTFSTMAGTIGGGAQMPGFMGIGKSYLASRKFVPADGGLARLVWMPKALKEQLRPQLEEAAEEAGLGRDFVDKIADETVGTSGEEILPFLEEKGHPALTLPPLL
ncbi:acetyl-CoA decarbonylase/synthase complex subunit alpha/beta [Desulfofundulus salinus]|uniref:CO-methylating acetyl-CoA synthase n=1 Tax=Desulfofundulus salinus TaxID=2419843 RepID=A0A494WUQ7_9FIRM|nr:acetyl-CoA decarbonylase/synthase complex subunit alpha/beta [Desulfofundulus salinum]RKO67106.1 CO dehydrogenase/CO-methylating acetyl-CoA synthase complex subunit beta [Desulfofundulus salinum]